MNRNTQRPIARAIAQDSRKYWLAAGVLAAGIIITAGTARAESVFSTAAGPTTANARLDFQIVIPRFLFLQVGTGTALATNGTINVLTFTVPAASIGTGGAGIGSTGGDINAGASVTAKVLGNNFTGGAVSFTATTTGALSDGAGDTISWSQFSVATAANTTGTVLAHPGTLAAPFTDGGATSVSLTPVSKVINQDAKWTFTYANTVIPAAGTYGTSANGGRVTYAVTMP